jgi:hypothetical protein
MARCFQELAPASNCRLEKLVQEDAVDTKNWCRKGTDLWAEFGNEMPLGRKISSKDSVKMLAVGSTPSFGRRTICAKKGSFREYVMTWLGYKERTN